jgi:hypothetical protein
VFEDIDFALERTGSITGTVTRQEDGTPVTSGTVEVWNSDGNRIGYDSTDTFGVYLISQLPPGVCFVTTDAGTSYIDELYDNIPCYGGAPSGCDPTKGMPITVDIGSDLRFVDFAIRSRRSGISGRIVQARSGIPISGVAVDAWSETGQRVDWTLTTGDGRFSVELDPGTYFVSTENSHGYSDQIYDNLLCVGGSAVSGACDPTVGTPVTVTEDEVTADVDFELFDLLFGDGFESGTLGSWSHVEP